MLVDPLNLSSTPIAILSELGLKTYAGVSSDDPKSERHLTTEFLVVLSAYGLNGLIARAIIDRLPPHHHKFYYLDDELQKMSIAEPVRLCAIHRVPANLIKDDTIPEAVELDETPDFDMYRIVVQYGTTSGSMGSVIYETPPNFNRVSKRGEFLSFSNKIYVSEKADTHLIFLNYSVNRNYSDSAQLHFNLYDSAGSLVSNKTLDVPSFNFVAINSKELMPTNPSKFYSYVASAIGNSLIPLSVIVCKSNGGVSVEHSHPPQAYIMADWQINSGIKRAAAIHCAGG